MSLTKRATGMPTNQVAPSRAALRKQLQDRMTKEQAARKPSAEKLRKPT